MPQPGDNLWPLVDDDDLPPDLPASKSPAPATTTPPPDQPAATVVSGPPAESPIPVEPPDPADPPSQEDTPDQQPSLESPQPALDPPTLLDSSEPARPPAESPPVESEDPPDPSSQDDASTPPPAESPEPPAPTEPADSSSDEDASTPPSSESPEPSAPAENPAPLSAQSLEDPPTLLEPVEPAPPPEIPAVDERAVPVESADSLSEEGASTSPAAESADESPESPVAPEPPTWFEPRASAEPAPPPAQDSQEAAPAQGLSSPPASPNWFVPRETTEPALPVEPQAGSLDVPGPTQQLPRRPLDPPTRIEPREPAAPRQHVQWRPPADARQVVRPPLDPPTRVEPRNPTTPIEASMRGQLEWPPPELPRAAPERIGPEPPPPVLIQPVPRRRGKRVALLVVAAVVLVAGGGAGAVYAVPGLKDKLGLGTSEPEVAIAPPPGPVQFAPALRAPGVGSPAPTPAGVAAALAGPMAQPGLGTLTGAVVDATSGETLWQQNAGTPLVPASTGKLLTAAAALLSVGHTEQLSTKVVAGKDPGTAIIVGGGDPTLSSLKVGADSVYPGAAHLSELVDQLKPHGIKTVYVDVSRYAGTAMEASWDAADVTAGHIAPITPVMLDGGRADATKATSPRSGTPAKAMAEELANRLGAKLAPEVTTTAPQGATVLGEVRSPPMVELIDIVLQRSDNVLAEAVGHEVARATGEEVSFAGASRATLKVLQQNGFDITGLSLADASGLSGQDKVPAKLLASVLAVAAGPDGRDPRTAKLRPLLGGLPVAGGSGTLSDRYNNPGATIGRGWVRAKTGTLSAPPVNSLAGVVLDADGRLLVFALLTNGSATATARPALDTIAATLRKCGCH